MKALLPLILLLVLACHRRPGEGVHVIEPGEEFRLSVGDSARLRAKATDLISFTGVVEDSRCPAGVQCIQAGRAVVNVRVLRNDTFETHTVVMDGTGRVVSDGGMFELSRLEPYPDAGVEEPEPYHLIVRLAESDRER